MFFMNSSEPRVSPQRIYLPDVEVVDACKLNFAEAKEGGVAVVKVDPRSARKTVHMLIVDYEGAKMFK